MSTFAHIAPNAAMLAQIASQAGAAGAV